MANANILKVTPTTSIDKIQECLKQAGKTIVFTKGTYNLPRMLTLYSNTKIVLTGATLVRKNPSHIFRGYVNPNVSYNYNAVKNITITGGTLDGDGLRQSGSILGIIHGSNIVVDGVHFKNTYYSHAIDVPACKDVTIKNCKFTERIIDPEGSYREDIQYDVAYLCGYPYYNKNAKVYNNNHCINITVDNCTFVGSNVCIGTHTETATDKKHSNLKITNCKATATDGKYDGCFARVINVDGADISNNTLEGFTRGIVVTSCPKLYNKDGSIITIKPVSKTGCNNIVISDNIIKNASGTLASSGIFVNSKLDGLLHDNIAISKNTFELNNTNAKNDIDVRDTNTSIISKNITKLRTLINGKLYKETNINK